MVILPVDVGCRVVLVTPELGPTVLFAAVDALMVEPGGGAVVFGKVVVLAGLLDVAETGGGGEEEDGGAPHELNSDCATTREAAKDIRRKRTLFLTSIPLPRLVVQRAEKSSNVHGQEVKRQERQEGWAADILIGSPTMRLIFCQRASGGCVHWRLSYFCMGNMRAMLQVNELERRAMAKAPADMRIAKHPR